MPLKLMWTVAWLTMIGLIVTPAFYVSGMMNDPAIESAISPDADSWGIPMFGDVVVGVIFAAVVHGLTTHFTQHYTRPSLFAWRQERLWRSLGYTVLATIIIALPVLAITYDFLNAPPLYEYYLLPLLILGVVWVAMLRAAAITMGDSERSASNAGRS